MLRLSALLLAACAVGAWADDAGNEQAAAGPSLLAYELKRLDEPKVESLSRFQGKPVLLIFFEPECNWCFRQVRDLNALGERCRTGFQPLAVGVNGNRSHLKEELRRLRPEFPAFEASPALLSALGGVPATPFALLGDANGDYLAWSRGYLPEEELHEFLAAQGVQSCEQVASGD